MPDIELYADSQQVEPSHDRRLLVTLKGVGVDDIVEAVGIATLLDEIGKDEVIDHFRLNLAEE